MLEKRVKELKRFYKTELEAAMFAENASADEVKEIIHRMRKEDWLYYEDVTEILAHCGLEIIETKKHFGRDELGRFESYVESETWFYDDDFGEEVFEF